MQPLPLLPTMGVGSYASPGWFISGRARLREGDFGPADSDEMFEDATRIAIADQVEAGLDIISDGELHRQRFVFEMFQHLHGLKRVPPARKLGVPGYDMAPHFTVEGAVTAPRGLGVVGEYQTLLRLAPGRHLKVALPGPVTFAGFMTAGSHDPGAVVESLIGIVRTELEGLAAAGVDYIQLDEPGLPEAPLGLSLDDCVAVINRTLAGFAFRRGVHVCFGNNAGRPMADRDIVRLMPGLVALKADEISLEFANREMAQVELVGELARRTDVAVGVVDVKNFRLEPKEAVTRRIELCLKHAPAERLRLTADCGFSALPRGLARRKMIALVDGARLVRGSRAA
ncbi:cobalamin-independent methionine synthase II family protein [Vineibacter terrae]|uniref:Cobalamin-independent methionine synthase II family protein n=1 Tax=Vineibacter terrae TaxID=2586908 RepID=A0A5C8PAF2_9HYPH|nr:cobalamin-independent methionine synthase II family protein [Vineibacter terrae]TXL70223.1 cobalamin-independent methionine synthase II family protein [Vineibacter terrae]